MTGTPTLFASFRASDSDWDGIAAPQMQARIRSRRCDTAPLKHTVHEFFDDPLIRKTQPLLARPVEHRIPDRRDHKPGRARGEPARRTLRDANFTADIRAGLV
jgi:hypothetical protein